MLFRSIPSPLSRRYRDDVRPSFYSGLYRTRKELVLICQFVQITVTVILLGEGSGTEGGTGGVYRRDDVPLKAKL